MWSLCSALLLSLPNFIYLRHSISSYFNQKSLPPRGSDRMRNVGNVFVDMAFNQHVAENGVLRAAIKNAYAENYICNIEQQVDAKASTAALALAVAIVAKIRQQNHHGLCDFKWHSGCRNSKFVLFFIVKLLSLLLVRFLFSSIVFIFSSQWYR